MLLYSYISCNFRASQRHHFCVFSVIPAHGSGASLSLLLLLLLAVAGFFGDDLWDVNYSDVYSSGGLDRQTWGGR